MQMIDRQLEAVAKQQGQNEAVMSQLLFMGQSHNGQLLMANDQQGHHNQLQPSLLDEAKRSEQEAMLANEANINSQMQLGAHDPNSIMHQQNEALQQQHNQILADHLSSQSTTPQNEHTMMQQQQQQQATPPLPQHPTGDQQQNGGQMQQPTSDDVNEQTVYNPMLQSMPNPVPLSGGVMQDLGERQLQQQSPAASMSQPQILSNPSSHSSTPHLHAQEVVGSQHHTPEQQHEQILQGIMASVSHTMASNTHDASLQQQQAQVAAMQHAVAQHVQAQQMAAAVAAQQATPGMAYDGDMKQQQQTSPSMNQMMSAAATDPQNYNNAVMGNAKEVQVPASHVVPSQLGSSMAQNMNSVVSDTMMQHVHVEQQNQRSYNTMRNNMMEANQAVQMHSALMQQQQMQQLHQHIQAMHNSQTQQQQQQQQPSQEDLSSAEHGTKRPYDAGATAAAQQRKSRRHTVSSPYPSHLNMLQKPNLYIDTANLQSRHQPPFVPIVPSQMGQSPTTNHGASLPGSIANSPQEGKYPGGFNHIALPARPTSLSQMNIESQSTASLSRNVAQAAHVSVKEFEHMSREQLISRLVQLEQEKRGHSPGSNSAHSATTPIPSTLQQSTTAETMHDNARPSAAEAAVTDTSTNPDDDDDGPNTPTDNHASTDKVKAEGGESKNDDGEEEDVDEDEDEDADEDAPKEEQKMQCRWINCGLVCETLESLISHIGEAHVGSGKASYSCNWEGCARAQKPFTKRHKMYNHLRTHTGERPYVCHKEGCGKRFSRPDSLTTHIKTHSNIRPYVCSFKGCKKAYYHSRSLKKHERTHAGHDSGETNDANIGYIPSQMDAQNVAGGYPTYAPRPPPYVQPPPPYNAQPIPTPEKMAENQAAYMAHHQEQQAAAAAGINVSQLGQMASMNAYAQPGQNPGGQIYNPLVAIKYNPPGQQIQPSIPHQQQFSGNNTPISMSNQPSQAYAYGAHPSI
ncbi:hypothetical protein INT44_000498 [Umbelopsis vinacea]|uniref:C2H2-type domain-containing protein n=2 Tax=Umbelopsis TaxID=64561 RepID=A0A8H7UE13_9FUNG|nr:hypothetical protein INT44_000498 [Umbelopsis vinacea]